MKNIKRLVCTLLLLSMIASMFLVVNAADSNRSGISIDRVTSKNKMGESVTYPEGYYTTDKRFEEAPVTFEFWAYIPSKFWSSASGVVLSNWAEIGAPKNTNDWFTLTIEPKGTPKLAIGYSDGRINEKQFEGLIKKDSWTHIAMVLDQNARKIKMYVNGAAKGQLGFGEGSKDSILNENLDNMIYLLSDARPGNKKAMCDIKLSDVAVYSDMRSASEVKSDYTSGADVKDKNLMLYYQISEEDKEKDIKDASGNGYDMNYYRTFYTEAEMKEIREQDSSEYAYSMVLVPDTHFWEGASVAKRSAIFDYVIKNKESKNIKYVIGVGDMTSNGQKGEWPLVKQEYSRLDKAGIPYSVVRGNHDTIRDSSYFNNVFGPGTAYYEYVEENGGFCKEGTSINTYICFKAGDVDYLMLNLDFGIKSKELTWANKVIASHPNHRVIVVIHAWLGSDGKILNASSYGAPSMYDPNFFNPDYIWGKCLSRHENVDMIVSGHTHSDQILTTPIVGKNGNVVHQVLVNNQCSPEHFKGLGNIAIMNFTADGRFASVAYYATVHDKYFYEGSADIKLDLDATAFATTDISGKVSLTGGNVSDGDFSFLLNSSDSKFVVNSSKTPVKAANAADGSFVFKDITFEKEGTYYFVISADNSVDDKNISIDESVYHVKIEVVKDRNGILEVSETLITKKGGTQAQDIIEFTNVYSDSKNILWICLVAAVVVVGAAAVVLVVAVKRKRAKKE